jgi:glycosyltransferase involved in cell wall biosynthesis
VSAQPLVSILTPVYNAEQYLAQCIESVLAQTYGHWEYVIVDNCSTDMSLAIAQDYMRRDGRIRVLQNTRFLTALQNQNHALRQIAPNSTYCKIVHADDWLFPRCLEEMVRVAEAYPSVGIVSAYRLDGTRVNLDGLPYPSTFISGREICRRTLLGEIYVFGSPSSLLLRSELVRARDPFYLEDRPWADTRVCFEILQHYDFGFVHQVLTFTRRHKEAVSSLAVKLNTYSVAAVDLLTTYGPIYLSPGEQQRCLHGALRAYYRFLAASAIRGRGRAFWQYHRDMMRTIGHPLNPARLVLGLADLFLAGAAMPIRRIERMWTQ